MTTEALFEDHDFPEMAALRETARRFAREQVAPHHAQWERDGMVSREVWRAAGAAGLLCMTAPEAYGGAGADFRACQVFTQELGRLGLSGPVFHLHSEIVAPYLAHYGTEAQKQRWLPRMASGEVIGAIAMTEPDTGSDLAAIRTRAVQQPDGRWKLSGQKTFISNGQLADLVIVAAKTQPEKGAKGVSLLLVDTTLPGFRRGRKLDKLGMLAQDTSELFFDDMLLPADALLGEDGRGFGYLMTELPQERLLVALWAVAAMEGAVLWARDWLRERKAFGAPLADKQVLRHGLAACWSDTLAARAFAEDCVRRHVEGRLDSATASAIKAWASEMQFSVLDRCLQMFGGWGYMRELPIARAWADARVQRIYGGTTEIMRELVARRLFD
jgi:acyl-CoA dehydrogenase